MVCPRWAFGRAFIIMGSLGNPTKMCSGWNFPQPSAGLVNEQWLAHIGDFGYRAFEVEGLGQHDLEDLSGGQT